MLQTKVGLRNIYKAIYLIKLKNDLVKVTFFWSKKCFKGNGYLLNKYFLD